jgi:hypothetical protein
MKVEMFVGRFCSFNPTTITLPANNSGLTGCIIRTSNTFQNSLVSGAKGGGDAIRNYFFPSYKMSPYLSKNLAPYLLRTREGRRNSR